MSDVKITLEKFEGPLSLLIYFIRKEDMNIFDINIVQITDQYLSFVKNMRTLDLERAGDFIAMAATLIQIKSKMLVPHEDKEGDGEEPEDPRQQLVEQLLEYERFKKISDKLYERPLLGRDVWIKGYREKFLLSRPDDVVKVDENPLYALILSYKKALEKVKKSVHKVGAKLQSIASRVMELKNILSMKKKTSLRELTHVDSEVNQNERSKLLITFLSLLEIAKMGYASLFQSQNFSDIHVTVTKDISRDIVSQVEDYETLHKDLQVHLFPSQQVDLDEEIGVEAEDFIQATDEDIEEAEKEMLG